MAADRRALISVPLQLNYDDGYGVGGAGERFTLSLQPVVPVSLNDDSVRAVA